jgi:hypothetical protein
MEPEKSIALGVTGVVMNYAAIAMDLAMKNVICGGVYCGRPVEIVTGVVTKIVIIVMEVAWKSVKTAVVEEKNIVPHVRDAGTLSERDIHFISNGLIYHNGKYELRKGG